MKIELRTICGLNRYVVTTIQDRTFRILGIDAGSYVCDLDVNSSLEGLGITECYNICIGRYSSVGARINCIVDMNHDYNSLYQGVVTSLSGGPWRNGNGQILKRVKRKGEILIGNDVWVGNGVTILGGVRIGDGAVAAAESVVVKDVPPYAIVGGNPAKIIKYRFPKDTIRKLRNIEWWNWTEEEMLQRKEDMHGEVVEFADKYYRPGAIYSKKSGMFIPRITEKATVRFLHFMDLDDAFPIYIQVVRQFINQYVNKDMELILCYYADEPSECEKMQEIMETLHEIDELPILINVCGIEKEDEEKVISEADYLITNRNVRTIQQLNIADKYGVAILYGTNIPLFSEELPKPREEFMIE